MPPFLKELDKPSAAPSVSKLIMTLPNTGCAHDCGWCGGSRFAYRNIMDVSKTLIQKDNDLIAAELRTMGEAAKRTSIYALRAKVPGLPCHPFRR